MEYKKRSRKRNSKKGNEKHDEGMVRVLVLFFVVIVIGFASYKVTHGFFSSSAASTSNVFSASEVFPTSTPTPSPTPIPINPGDVVINEIMWMGSHVSSADEWIELRNMTSNTIDLSNWVVENLGSGVSNDIKITAGKTIAPNGFFLISNDSKATSIINVDPDVQTSSVSLLNPGEQLRLKTSTISGILIDTANASPGAWFAGEDPPGENPKKSMERNNVPGDGTVSTNWHTATTQVNLDLTASESATPRATND